MAAHVDPMRERTERLLESTDGMRRVRIAERNGLYVIMEERYFENIWEGRTIAKGWHVLPGDASYFIDAETAEQEARLLYPWLSS